MIFVSKDHWKSWSLSSETKYPQRCQDWIFGCKKKCQLCDAVGFLLEIPVEPRHRRSKVVNYTRDGRLDGCWMAVGWWVGHMTLESRRLFSHGKFGFLAKSWGKWHLKTQKSPWERLSKSRISCDLNFSLEEHHLYLDWVIFALKQARVSWETILELNNEKSSTWKTFFCERLSMSLWRLELCSSRVVKVIWNMGFLIPNGFTISLYNHLFNLIDGVYSCQVQFDTILNDSTYTIRLVWR